MRSIASVVFEGFDERQVALLGCAERITLYRGTFISAIADAGAVSESFGFGSKFFGFGNIEGIVGVEIFFEAVEVFVLNEVDGERV